MDFSQFPPYGLPNADASVHTQAQGQFQPQLQLPTFLTPPIQVNLMFKNRLQEFTQKLGIDLPMYSTQNESSSWNAPAFRSTVVVDGQSFTSPYVFHNRKMAEQDVARIALEMMKKKMNNDTCPYIPEDTLFSKSILHEYAVKMSFNKPTYETVAVKGATPTFSSSLLFNGVTYRGNVAKSKKEAEQLAARAAIFSLYDDEKSKIVLAKIIKSKLKNYGGVAYDKSCSSTSEPKIPVPEPLANEQKIRVPELSANEQKTPVPEPSTNEHKIPDPEPPGANYDPNMKHSVTCSAKVNLLPHTFRLPGTEPKLPETMPEGAIEIPRALISFVPSSNLQQSSDSAPTSKKRRKNKKKAGKKARVDPLMPIAAMPCNH